VACAIDFAIFDTLIVIYAFYSLDTPYLHFLAFRGFYIQVTKEALYSRLSAAEIQPPQEVSDN
jgi:hypothetical protein